MNSPLSETDFDVEVIILDTETTGLGNPEPIEIGYLSLPALHQFAGKNFISALPKLPQTVARYKPTKAITAGATKVHGIIFADVAHKPQYQAQVFSDSLPPTVKYFICHNATFDWKVLTCEPSGYNEEEHFQDLLPICTLKIARKIWPHFKSKSLTKIIEEFCPDVAEKLTAHAHGAIADCLLTALIVHFAITEFEITSWNDLYELQF